MEPYRVALLDLGNDDVLLFRPGRGIAREKKVVLDELLVAFDTEGWLQHQGWAAGGYLDVASLARLATSYASPPGAGSRFDGWNIWSILLHLSLCEQDDIEKLQRCYYNVDSTKTRGVELEKLLRLFGTAVSKLAELLDERQKQELKEVDIAVQQLVNDASRAGICFDRTGFSAEVRSLIDNLYSLRNRLQVEYNLPSIDDDRLGVAEKLSQLEKRRVAKNSSESEILQFVDEYAENDDLCGLIQRERKLTRSLDILLRLDGGSGSTVHPEHIVFGAITGRIVTQNPPLQSLAKPWRRFLVPRDGMAFVYVDYDQFEIAVLASLSRDEGLLKAVRGGDVYSTVAGVIGADRESAKRVFFRVLYGDGEPGEIGDERAGKVRAFMEAFPQVGELKEGVTKSARSSGVVSTQFGATRRLKPHMNARWALSHLVQATASAVFKVALLRAGQLRTAGAELRLPVHDGALYEVPAKLKEDLSERLVSSFNDAALEKLGESICTASIKSFFPE